MHRLTGDNVQEVVLSDGRKWTVVTTAEEEGPLGGQDGISVEGSEVWFNMHKEGKAFRIRLA